MEQTKHFVLWKDADNNYSVTYYTEHYEKSVNLKITEEEAEIIMEQLEIGINEIPL